MIQVVLTLRQLVSSIIQLMDLRLLPVRKVCYHLLQQLTRQDIPFSLSFEAIGTQGTGVDSTLAIATSALIDPASPANILTVSVSKVHQRLALNVDVTLDSTVEDQMSIAGSC